MLPLLLAGLLSAGTSAPQRQTTGVEGEVSDGVAPIAGAVVKLTCGAFEASTVTDTAGLYRFDQRPHGNCRVSVESGGMEPQINALLPEQHVLLFVLKRNAGVGLPARPRALSLMSTPVDQNASPEIRRRFTFDRDVAAGASRLEDDFQASDSGAKWTYRTRYTYSPGGGVAVGFGLSASHGVHAPGYMSDVPGGGKSLNLENDSHVDVTGSRLWDIRFFARRRVFESRGGASVDLLMEMHQPLNTGFDRSIPASFRPLRSRAFRFGIVLSY